MGLHVRSHAHANQSSWKRVRHWYWKLARFDFLGSSFSYCIGQVDLEVLLHLRWYVNIFLVAIIINLLTFQLAFDILITIPVVFFFFKETKQVSLEDIDLLFGERALGTLPDDLHKGGPTELENKGPLAADTELREKTVAGAAA